MLQTTLPVLPAITRQPGFLWFVVRDSCVERLFVCTSASSLIMMSSHWCAPPSRSRKTLALWLPSSRSSGPLSGAALLLDTCSLLQPAQFFVRKRSSEKSEVLVTVSVLDAKSCGAETVPELVTSPHTTLPVDTPPLVAVKVQSRLSQSSGPAEAAPVIVSVAPVSAPLAAKLAAVAAPEAVSVPVDTSPTVVKFPALAVLLMVSVLPVIPVAELSRPTLAAPVMLSELPDTAPVDDSAAPATVPAVSAAQETVPEASTPVVNTSVQFTSLHSSWSQPTLPCAVSPSSVAEPVRASESASRSVTETDSPSKALALICMLYRSSVPADCCTSPGMEPPKAPKCSFAIPPGGTEVQARRAPHALRGRAEESAGDAHVVVVGRADVHHQVGGRAQPVPAAEGVASPRRQRVGADDVPGKGAQGHGVALQLEASHREAGRGHGAVAVGAHQEIS